MRKLGVFKDEFGKSFNIVWYVSKNTDSERIDIFDNVATYNSMDTSSCKCSFIKTTVDLVTGDRDLIGKLRNIIYMCKTVKADSNVETDFCDEGLLIKETKINDNIGLHFYCEMLDGVIRKEEYKFNGCELHIGLVKDVDTDILMNPLNMSDYKTLDIVSGEILDGVGELDYYTLDQLKMRYDLDHIEDCDFVVVSSIEEADARLKEFEEAKFEFKAVDIESTGLDVTVYGEDVITGVVLSYDDESENSTYFPFRQDNFDFNLPIEYLGKIVEVINNQPKDVKICAYNAKMEIKSFMKDNYNLRVDMDGYLISTILNTVMRRGIHALKTHAEHITNKKYLELKEIFKTKDIKFNTLPPDIVRYYACADGPNTIRVIKYLLSKLPKEQLQQLDIENQLVYAKSIQEYYGLRSDVNKLQESIKVVEYNVNLLSNLFKEIHRTSKNINSYQVLSEIVYKKLGCKVEVRTKNDQPSVSAAAIDRIVDLGKIKNPDMSNKPDDIVGGDGKVLIKGEDLISNKYFSLVILSKYNEEKKKLSELKRLVKKSNKGRIMFNINQTGAASGRQTSDAHQYSSTMKEIVIADTPEHDLTSTDYAQVELRVLAYLVGDEKLIELMKDYHVDIHRAFLSAITGKPIYLISAKERSNGKRVNFGVVYGISEYGLAKDQYGVGYSKEQLNICRKSIVDFYNGLPLIKQFSVDNEKFLKTHGYITTRFGSRRNFPEILDPTTSDKKIQSMVRAGNNTPVQGFAAYLMKQAEINYVNYIKAKGWDECVEYNGGMFPKVRVMLSIHDEVLTSSHKSIPREEIILMHKICQEIEIEGAPPFFATPAFIDNWQQAKEDKYELPVGFRNKIVEAYVNDGVTGLLGRETYLEDIKNYRKSVVIDYMNGLIAQYKTVDKVYENLNHPEHTHSLIAMYAGDVVKTHTHTECMRIAVERYMEDSGSHNLDAEDKVEALVEMKQRDIEEDSYLKDSMNLLNKIEKFVEIDEDGNYIEEDAEEDDEDDLSYLDRYYTTYEEEEFVELDVVYALNQAVIYLNSFKDIDVLESIIKEIAKLGDSKEYYDVIAVVNNQFLKLGFKIGYKPNDIRAIISKYKEM